MARLRPPKVTDKLIPASSDSWMPVAGKQGNDRRVAALHERPSLAADDQAPSPDSWAGRRATSPCRGNRARRRAGRTDGNFSTYSAQRPAADRLQPVLAGYACTSRYRR
jgi:hypothetical protein